MALNADQIRTIDRNMEGVSRDCDPDYRALFTLMSERLFNITPTEPDYWWWMLNDWRS